MSTSDIKQDDVRVLVTGASGFIAGHIIIQLLEAGYRVRGTVRDSKKSQAVLDLAKSVPNARYPIIELAEVELTNEKGWNDAVRDCIYVLHTASPFVVETPKDENELIKPAVEGTLTVLKAVAATHGQVKRVVLTSSIAAIAYGHPKEIYNTKKFNESDWSIANNCSAYSKSKTLAEKAAWDFLATLPAEDKFELTTINPGYVQGPVLTDKGCASQEIVQRLLTGKVPGIPALTYGVVDVRDVALAHLRAMTTPEAAGQRYLCSADTMWMMDFATTLKQEFPTYKVGTMKAPKFVLSIVQLWDKGVRSILPDVGKPLNIDNTKIQKEFGITFRSARQSVIDMAYSLINLGIVPTKKQKKKLEIKQDEKQEQKTTSETAQTPASASAPAPAAAATTDVAPTSTPATTTSETASTSASATAPAVATNVSASTSTSTSTSTTAPDTISTTTTTATASTEPSAPATTDTSAITTTSPATTASETPSSVAS